MIPIIRETLPDLRLDVDESNPYAGLDEAQIRDNIKAAKEEFIQADIDENQDTMFRLAKNLSELNEELADRKGGGPTASQFEEAAEKWSDIADLVLDGTDPTERLQPGSGSSNEDPLTSEDGTKIPDEITQFHQGVPERTFEDVGGYDEVKEYLREGGIDLIKHQAFLEDELNQSVLNGVVLTGPPGTGKTLMAQAFAGELDEELSADVTVFKVKPGQLKRGVRGESGKLMRGLFAAAKQAQPAVIIFEEIDSLVQDRSETSVQMMRSDRDLVNSFLEEINEIDTKDVIVMGTTNRADALDDAAIRDKRLDTIEMGLPDIVARIRIFRVHLNTVSSEYVDHDGIDVGSLAQETEGFTGATIKTVVDNALRTMGLEYKQGERTQPVLTEADLRTEIEKKKDDE